MNTNAGKTGDQRAALSGAACVHGSRIKSGMTIRGTKGKGPAVAGRAFGQ